jgi:tRNA isopentenyl-2-thiomethyl-A-37 hydroxylase MiaE
LFLLLIEHSQVECKSGRAVLSVLSKYEVRDSFP